ncbi:hypothetical protein PPL_08961 [Heterostelium album PN500]|uniref:Uncharacterized protein n=1 Tax=Heterostelium pallidum (strain ATCC 26659 / Pp 5 / PN500) TaxID=670386 RepID=D3BK80_HETP5|nr:hypothetical protein PPL_08961 [Heterostelium album PN500]EFA78310.1 hypothetical protein PPL_08961 [Heterostelium album PN500]|eukprot:XP_020430435.1 hypothetical protein PPL_08961 [Heterostelium album PN500]
MRFILSLLLSLFCLFSLSTAQTINITPYAKGSGSAPEGLGYSFPLGECLEFESDLDVQLLWTDLNQDNITLTYYSQGCKSVGQQYVFALNSLVEDFSLKYVYLPQSVVFSTENNMPAKAIQFYTYYTETNTCTGTSFLQYYTNGYKEPSGTNFQCLGGGKAQVVTCYGGNCIPTVYTTNQCNTDENPPYTVKC